MEWNDVSAGMINATCSWSSTGNGQLATAGYYDAEKFHNNNWQPASPAWTTLRLEVISGTASWRNVTVYAAKDTSGDYRGFYRMGYIAGDGLLDTGKIVEIPLAAPDPAYPYYFFEINASYDQVTFKAFIPGAAFKTDGGFIYDPLSGNMTLHNIAPTAGFNDLIGDELFLGYNTAGSYGAGDKINGCGITKWLAGDPLQYQWRSKLFTYPTPVTFSCCKVGAEAYPVMINVYGDGKELFQKIVADNKPFRLPSKAAKEWCVLLTGQTEVYEVVLADCMTELNHD